MNPSATDCCLILQEVLSIIFSYLDQPSLIHTLHVCRAWNEAAERLVWSDIRGLLLPAPSFMNRITQAGPRIRRLDLSLDLPTVMTPKTADHTLTKILQATPNIQQLSVKFPPSTLPTAIPRHLIIIRDVVGSQLRSLGLHASEPDRDSRLSLPFSVSAEEALDIFLGFTSLTSLAWGSAATDTLVRVIVCTIPTLTSLTLRSQTFQRLPVYDDATVHLIGARLTNLTQLGLINNKTLTAEGMIYLGNHCKSLTKLDLSKCENIRQDGFDAILSACQELTHLNFRATRVQNESLVMLSAEPRASKLRELNVRNCELLTDSGIAWILKSCKNLESLDFRGICLYRSNFFDEAPWVCTRLEHLSMGESLQKRLVGAYPLQNASSFLFKQLGRLTRLTRLEMSRLPMNLDLFKYGREELAKLTALEYLSIENNLLHKELLWIVNQLRTLKVIEVSSMHTGSSYARDLEEVYVGIQIKPFLYEVSDFPRVGLPFDDNSDDELIYGYPGAGYDYDVSNIYSGESGMGSPTSQHTFDDAAPSYENSIVGNIMYTLDDGDSTSDDSSIMDPRDSTSDDSSIMDPRDSTSDDSSIMDPRDSTSDDSSIMDPRDSTSDDSSIMDPRDSTSDDDDNIPDPGDSTSDSSPPIGTLSYSSHSDSGHGIGSSDGLDHESESGYGISSSDGPDHESDSSKQLDESMDENESTDGTRSMGRNESMSNSESMDGNGSLDDDKSIGSSIGNGSQDYGGEDSPEYDSPGHSGNSVIDGPDDDDDDDDDVGNVYDGSDDDDDNGNNDMASDHDGDGSNDGDDYGGYSS